MISQRTFPIPAISLALAITWLVSACGGGSGGGDPRNSITNPPSASFQPAVADSPYSQDLVACINAETTANLCRLSRLPFIGQQTDDPDKADILARTIVSHPWMATRFSQLLDQMPGDIHLLFRGVTGIAIGADIRPSYYWAATGAIYLDPADLWLTADERNTISRAPDFRSDFARELAFSSPWRYVQGNAYAWDSYPLNGPISSRPLSAIVKPMAALLFHELAHANDFIPPARMAAVNPQNTPLTQAIAFQNHNISFDLANRQPLQSDMLYELAKVIFEGEKATTAQKQLSAETVGLEFAADGASDDYAYASWFEDTAMLFEEVMMKYHFGVDREMAFTDAPSSANAPCSAHVVRWGERNRIGNELVKSRATLVVQQLLDKTDVTAYFANLPAPRALRNGVDWCTNLATFGHNTATFQKASREPLRPDDLRLRDRHSHSHFERRH